MQAEFYPSTASEVHHSQQMSVGGLARVCHFSHKPIVRRTSIWTWTQAKDAVRNARQAYVSSKSMSKTVSHSHRLAFRSIAAALCGGCDELHAKCAPGLQCVAGTCMLNRGMSECGGSPKTVKSKMNNSNYEFDREVLVHISSAGFRISASMRQ